MPPTKSGERRIQILQTLAQMLEHPKGERVTTAALAAKLEVSEAALYRHFASKAQMFEGLMEFIEDSLFGLMNQIESQDESGLKQAQRKLQLLLQFAEKNKGMTRVLIGDALVTEDDRLQDRMNQTLERIEASLRQSLKIALEKNELPAQDNVNARASLIMHYILGRWHRFAKGGFKLAPTAGVQEQMVLLLA